ncbi:acyl-CoA dehydrogenase family protein [Actinomadura sp. KC345]|uniref:acyl-CoA dehydrogenase family protein n=1 Tax=Actinomadura sp. KC345 TaxID=2530371 RepID=UPI00140527A7|nr:acyl-CoA dehydrogenase family protein [Actinomadura sp. KC345]
MDLEPTPEQRDAAAAFDRVLARESSVERVRAVENAGFDPALWKVLVETGAVGIAVPGTDGATGGLLDLAFVTEAAGRHLACAPLVEAASAAMLLAAVDGREARPAPAPAGGPPVVLCPRPAVAGTAVLVPGGAAARGVVALDGGDLVLAEGPPPAPTGDLGFLACADRRLGGAAVERTVLARGEEARDLFRTGLGWWRLGTASALAGVADRALAVAVDYAGTREQFGVRIGTFQAIQHLLAEAVMAVDGARLLVRETAWRHDEGDAGWRDAADTAFAHAAETAVRSAEACLHVHGGYGYTLEYDAQLYLRRAKALQLQGGDPEAIWASTGAAAMRRAG